jgi:hypothetical protein
MLTVFVAPVPEAVTPAPVKLTVVAAVASDEPSSWTVRDDPPPPVPPETSVSTPASSLEYRSPSAFA